MDTLVLLVEPLASLNYNRISVGFPGVVRRGIIYTAANLGQEAFQGFALADELSKRLGHPVRAINDADMQGLAVIKGHGVELVITLGTGMGSAIFSEGQLGPAPGDLASSFAQGEDVRGLGWTGGARKRRQEKMEPPGAKGPSRTCGF